MPDGDGVRYVQRGVGNDTRKQAGNQDVQNRANNQGTQNADGHIPLGVLGFLRGRRNRVKSDIGEEDDRRPARDSRPAVSPERSLVGGNERMPIRPEDARGGRAQ